MMVLITNASGEVTVSKLTTGRHIIKVEKDGKTTYQVINAREMNYEILDTNGNKITDTTKLKAGDKINIQFKWSFKSSGKASRCI